MVSKLCKVVAIMFMFVSLFFFSIAICFLNSKQRKKLTDILDIVLFELQYGEYNDPEPQTIEDILFQDCVDLTKQDYHKGTNSDLTIECRMCGENTRRGKYYARNGVTDTNQDISYMFICPKCYKELPDGRDKEV